MAKTKAWVKNVKLKKHPPSGLFQKGSAEEIASWVIKSHDDLQSAMASLNFFLNRGGDKLPVSVRQRVRKAKSIVKNHFNS